jgi:hypothetical protein
LEGSESTPQEEEGCMGSIYSLLAHGYFSQHDDDQIRMTTTYAAKTVEKKRSGPVSRYVGVSIIHRQQQEKTK